MSVYYNECDPFAAAWLRELMRDGLIAPGWVDERSIEDVTPQEVEGFTQCHFFAGIGVWSLALRVAGWPDERPIWTGSCPCQPFSAAGKGAGFADERHLWPAWFHLVTLCNPSVVLGEQVASADGLEWLDLVSCDMETKGYAFGAVDTCAAGYKQKNNRQRLYFAGVAHTYDARSQGFRLSDQLVDETTSRQWALADRYGTTSCIDAQRVTGADGFEDCDILDRYIYSAGKMYPLQPDIRPLVDAGSFRNRVGALRGAGNALNLAQATKFIRAMMEVLDQ